MQAFPLGGFQEAVEVVERSAPDYSEPGRLVQGCRRVRLPAREFDLVAAEAQCAWSKVAMEVDEHAVAGFEVRLNERVLLIADAQEIFGNRQSRLSDVDDDLRWGALAGGQREPAEQGDRTE